MNVIWLDDYRKPCRTRADNLGMTLTPAYLSDYLLHLSAAAAATTVRLRAHQPDHAHRCCGDLLAATPERLLGWLTARNPKPETYKSRRAALVSFYGWAAQRGHLPDDPSRLLPRRRIPRAEPRPTPPTLVERAWLHADDRDRVALALAVEMGLRRAEIADAASEHVEDGCLRVTGKGDVQRLIPIPRDVLTLLPTSGPLVPSKHHGGHLKPGSVGVLLKRLLDAPGWSGHSLRSRFATDLHDRTGSVFVTQRLLGHASPTTTQRYVLVGLDQLREAMAA